MCRITVRVRKEVVLCLKCRCPKEFFYLSDFSYGERLILINDGTEYAFVNLFEDEVFDEFKNLVISIIMEYNIEFTKVKLAEVVNNIFGISCDDIDGKKIDTSHKEEKCIQCGSKEFEGNLIEPQELVDIDVPIVTHELWKKMSNAEKRENIEKELQIRKNI